MKNEIVKKLEEQISNYVDTAYFEQLADINNRVKRAADFYDEMHLKYKVPPGKELYHMGKLLDYEYNVYNYSMSELEAQDIDWPEDPFELGEEMS